MSVLDNLYTTGEEILAAARRRFLPLEPNGLTRLEEGGWEPSTEQGGLYASRIDDSTQSYAFLAVRDFAAPPMHLFCLVREFDLGKLAGDLKEFHVRESSAEAERVEYVSILPWPFEPRWILATLRFGVVRETGALVILGESIAGATAPPGMTPGTVHYSFYHISAGKNPGTCVMRRVINVDMHLPLPTFVVRKSLGAHYVSDMALIDKDLAAWQGSKLQERLQTRDYYRTVERAVAAARK